MRNWQLCDLQDGDVACRLLRVEMCWSSSVETLRDSMFALTCVHLQVLALWEIQRLQLHFNGRHVEKVKQYPYEWAQESHNWMLLNWAAISP